MVDSLGPPSHGAVTGDMIPLYGGPCHGMTAPLGGTHLTIVQPDRPFSRINYSRWEYDWVITDDRTIIGVYRGERDDVE